MQASAYLCRVLFLIGSLLLMAPTTVGCISSCSGDGDGDGDGDAGSPVVDGGDNDGDGDGDAGAPMADGGDNGDGDAGSPMADGGDNGDGDGGSPDSGMVGPADGGNHDGDGGSLDSGTVGPADGGDHDGDGGTPVVDSGEPNIDSGTPAMDAGGPAADGGALAADAGASISDGGAAAGDAGEPNFDGGAVSSDAGTSSADGGLTSNADPCPSGTFVIDNGDGTFDCATPDAVGCNDADTNDDETLNLSNLGTACSFESLGQTLNGVCFGFEPGELACLAQCSPNTGAASPSNDEIACSNTASVCYASGLLGSENTFGVCIADNTFTSENSCPSGTHQIDKSDGILECVPPSRIACSGKADLQGCSYDYFGEDISGTCYGGACVEGCGLAGMNNYYVAGAREICGNTNSVCQVVGSVGDEAAAVGVCIATTTSCAQSGTDDDARCAAGTFGCDDGACAPPSVFECMTGAFVCASNPSTVCTHGQGAECAQGAADCSVPIFQPTGSVCYVDRDLDANDDTNEAGRCVPVAGSSIGAHECLPDCTSDGTCVARDAADTNTYYCQELEADGSGERRASLGYTPTTDIGACISASHACFADSDCPTSSSVACDADQGVCLTPSLSACSGGTANSGTACDSDGGGDDDGRCVDDGGDGTVCRKTCTGSGAGDCSTADATCTDTGSGYKVCL